MSTPTPTTDAAHEVVSHAERRERKKEVAKRVEAYAFDDRAAAIEQLAVVYDMDIKTVQGACRRYGVRYPGQKSKPLPAAPTQRTTRTKPSPRRAAGARA